MGDLAAVYEDARRSIHELVSGLDEADHESVVPATPEWRVRDIVAHLIGDIESIISSDFPTAFFMAFGEPEAVALLNNWTAGHIAKRASHEMSQMLDEWERLAQDMYPMLRNERPWPTGIPSDLVGGVLITDIGAHLHDLYGAFGIDTGRQGPPVSIAVAGYAAMADLRLRNNGGGTLSFDLGDKTRTAGTGSPQATLRAPRFEVFRSLSGRRSKDQLRAYEWSGDPEPFLDYFYPYGERIEALVE